MKYIITILILLMLNGCGDGMKRSLGLIQEAPDEFMVVSQPDLILPPNFNLIKPETPITQYNSIIVPSTYQSSVKKFSLSEQNFLNHLGLNKVDNQIRMELNKHKPYHEFTDQKSVLTKAKEIITREDEDNIKHVIIPVEEKKRLEENIKNNKSLSDGEIQIQKNEKTLWDKISGQ